VIRRTASATLRASGSTPPAAAAIEAWRRAVGSSAIDRVEQRASPTGNRAGPGAHQPPQEGSMRVVVNFDVCESNALCMGVAPEVFEVRDDDFLYVLMEEPPEEMRPKVEEAVRVCPKQAISIED
jgi:ferredoxin